MAMTDEQRTEDARLILAARDLMSNQIGFFILGRTAEYVLTRNLSKIKGEEAERKYGEVITTLVSRGYNPVKLSRKIVELVYEGQLVGN
jgi:hypothetical protein